MATSAYFIARFYSFKLIDRNSVLDYVSNVDLITNMWCRKGRGISEIEIMDIAEILSSLA